MGTREKIDAEIDKDKAKNQSTYEKTKADFESDGLTKELKHVGSKVKKDVKIAKADMKEKTS